MNTLKRMVLLATFAGSALAASAQVFDFNLDPAKEIPNNLPEGTADVQTLTGIGSFPQGFALTVKLNIQGLLEGSANNGDYYATLTHIAANNGSTAKAVLLNRPGRTASSLNGYGDSGFNITLKDGAPDIHTYKTVTGFEGYLSPVTGTWSPDARGANPGLGLDTDARNSPLSVFSSMDPNGDWILFVQDAGDLGVGKLASWGLEFTAVPEPHQYALIAGLALIGFALYRRYSLKVA